MNRIATAVGSALAVTAPPVQAPAFAAPIAAQPAGQRARKLKKAAIWGGIAVVVIGLVVAVVVALRPKGAPVGFASGNGRIEATEVEVGTKLGGRVEAILVNEGDLVEAGQLLVRMQSDALDAQHAEALAQARKATTAVAAAKAQVGARQSDLAARRSDVAVAESVAVQRGAELDAMRRRLDRTEVLFKGNVVPPQDVDDDRARAHGADAALAAARSQTAAARAQVAAAQAAIDAAEAQVVGADASVEAANAAVARVEADLEDTQIKAQRDGRVQYRVAQPGEVLAGGHTVVSLIDLSDVYMTFFLPETAVGKVGLGSEVRIVLDAAPQYVTPAIVSYVASTAQFTPKTVETASERQKLMFRVKAQIPRELLRKHRAFVKTGLPGMAWVRLAPEASWPANLELNVPQ